MSIEPLYNTERNERGLEAVDCGAVLRDRETLACFPGRNYPDPAYTMEGWVITVVAANFSGDYNRWLRPQNWKRDSASPVVSLGKPGVFDDSVRSVLTPTLLRSPDGAVLREDGKLRMWFTAADLTVAGAPHTLHEAESVDGIHWSPPSPAQLDNIYAPTIIKEGDTYRLWYTDVSREPWIMRHAFSRDGKNWRVSRKPAVVIDQA